MTLPIRPSLDWYPTRRPWPQPVVRRLLHLSVLFVSLFLLVRTLALEPFGVTTGSMAPTLLGIHRTAPCPRCDWPVTVDEQGPKARSVVWDRCQCPNCGQTVDLSDARILPGDRLLVDKTAFLYREPRRWEVAVFHCPADRSKPYVKRLVGRPGEFIQISDGDVYADGRLLRKSLAQVRELMVPVFDLDYAPANVRAMRWLLENADWQDGATILGGQEKPASVTYRHWNLDTDREEPIDGWLSYNGGPIERRGRFGRLNRGDCAHDFVAVFDLTTGPQQENGANDGWLRCQIGDGADMVVATLQICQDLKSDRRPARLQSANQSGTEGDFRLAPSRTYRIEFALVDRRASLAVDGVEVVPSFDFPADRPGTARRRGVTQPVTVSAGGYGRPLSIRQFKLFCDLHYLPFGVAASGYQLGPAEYFALGDNTTNSYDSRTWQIDDRPAPGVPAHGLIGKPFFIHQPVRLARSPIGGGLIQTLDWDRLRLLR